MSSAKGPNKTVAKTRVLIVVFQPDGTVIVNNVESDREVTRSIGGKVGSIVSSFTLSSVPKRLAFFLEKWGKQPREIDKDNEE